MATRLFFRPRLSSRVVPRSSSKLASEAPRLSSRAAPRGRPLVFPSCPPGAPRLSFGDAFPRSPSWASRGARESFANNARCGCIFCKVPGPPSGLPGRPARALQIMSDAAVYFAGSWGPPWESRGGPGELCKSCCMRLYILQGPGGPLGLAGRKFR